MRKETWKSPTWNEWEKSGPFEAEDLKLLIAWMAVNY
jgi:hypothetical protein